MTILTHNSHDEEARRMNGNRPLIQLWPVTPDVAVGVEDSLNIVLVTAEGKGPHWTLSNVDALTFALSMAREYVTVHEAVMADWKHDPEQGKSILAHLYPGIAP